MTCFLQNWIPGVNLYGLSDPFDLLRRAGEQSCVVAQISVGMCGNQEWDAELFGQRFYSGCRIDGVADCGVFHPTWRADAADDSGTGVDTDPDLQGTVFSEHELIA